MGNELLTGVLTELINKKASNEYGVALINIPDFDYAELVNKLTSKKTIEIFFLGFADSAEQELGCSLPKNERVKYSFTVEAAEESRNSGDESIFRILIIKRADLQKLSSLRWFPEITLEDVYKKSCSYVRNKLSSSNTFIDSLLMALRNKQIRTLLSFERVIDYLQLLCSTPEEALTSAIKEGYYKLGLCADRNIDSNNPSKDELISRIKKNHKLVERISNLEQAERQSITSYYAKQSGDKSIASLILSFYKTKQLELLSKMELESVEECLKAAKKPRATANGSTGRAATKINPTALAAQLIFEDNQQQVAEALTEIKEKVDNRQDKNKAERIELEINGEKVSFKAEPLTERVADSLIGSSDFGGVIYAEVHSPDEAIRDIGNYDYKSFELSYLDKIQRDLNSIADLLPEREAISIRLNDFLRARESLVPYRARLQDAPMLQVLAEFKLFSDYLAAYERLLNAINEDFHRIWDVAARNAKEIVNVIMSLDYVFVVGENKQHAIPTPLHPMYLWKYVELAREILSSKGMTSIDEGSLDEEDKAFIIRKAEDIPDPLSVMLLPSTISDASAIFLPLSGRLGLLPIYSNQPQINQSESGMDILKQQIIRYLCLYPHSGMMLKLAVIDPPSVEAVVGMLKALDKDKEFRIEGIEVTIYRTKEVPASWVEIADSSLNDGMLGRFKGKRSINFKLRIRNQRYPYAKIISDISQSQHILVVFDPNEVRIDRATNNKQLHIHPLCVPKIYKYNPVEHIVEIRPANEGGIFTTYSSILEKLNERPASFSHTSSFFNTPLQLETYQQLLGRADWLVVLDQSLKTWDISMRAASEKLYYHETSYRSIGIYSKNCKKFITGYDTLIRQLGNLIPQQEGVKNVIEAIRDINDDGLLSIVSHSTNSIFDTNHGKGSLGTAIAAIHYKREHPNAIVVGLDTQLAREWLSDREDGRLPDLIGIRLDERDSATIDIIEVKTYSDNQGSFIINEAENSIAGHAVEQVFVLEELVKEMLGAAERITTVSRREILREQVYECLFQSDIESSQKLEYSNRLNTMFAGQCASIMVNKNITYVNFEQSDSTKRMLNGAADSYNGNICLTIIGSDEIQAILSNSSYISTDIEPDSAVQENAASLEMQPAVEAVACVAEAMSMPEPEEIDEAIDMENAEEKCAKINKIFRDYGINAYPVEPTMVQEAARFTRFKVELKSGETVRSLERYKNDIGRQLEADGEILINHIKGTKLISIDIPFAGAGKPISLTKHLDMLDSCDGFLNVIAGQTADGQFELVDIAGAPHMLVAGTTGSGKTIFLHSIIVSLLHQYSEDELELLIIDPKQTDFIFFEGIPHLYGGEVIIDAEKALERLQEINTRDKEERTQMLRSCRSKDIISYNEKNPDNKMKRLVVIIDEYSDLIQAAEMQGTRKEFERNLLMLLQRVRNLGIHLIIATQRPSAQIVTGALKAVIPFRVSFRLPSHTDSQTILDMPGAENLLGKGDMLMVTESDTMRLQGLYISEKEIESFVNKLI